MHLGIQEDVGCYETVYKSSQYDSTSIRIGGKQVSFIAEARSLNAKDLRKNLQVFKVPQAGIDTIRSRLVMKIYDKYANVLRGM